MKEFRSYWKKNKRWIGISFSFAVIFTVILMLYDISADTVWYAFALCFSVEVILLAVDFVKYYGKCKRMEEQYPISISVSRRMENLRIWWRGIIRRWLIHCSRGKRK